MIGLFIYLSIYLFDDDGDDDDDDCFQYVHHQLKHDYPLCFGSTEVSPVTLQVNAPDVHGQRPLHQAVLNKHQEAHACFFCINYSIIISGWWFGTFFPYIGNFIIPTDFHIFQRDSNHQPDITRNDGKDWGNYPMAHLEPGCNFPEVSRGQQVISCLQPIILGKRNL